MAPRILVTGSGGQLGSELFALGEKGRVPGQVEVRGIDIDTVDLIDRAATLDAIGNAAPEIVIHAAAWTDVDGCERDPERAMAANAWATRNVAEAARRCRAHLLYVSTDFVFDGAKENAYVEWDEPRPLNVYGASKLAGEREVDPGSTVVRTAWLAGPRGRNIVATALDLARRSGESLRFVDDQRGCPTFVEDLAPVVWRLALQRRPGVYHVTNQGSATWFELVQATLEEAGLDPHRVEPIVTSELEPPRPAVRPVNSVLDNAALRMAGDPLLPHWRDGLARLVGSMQSTIGR